MLSGFTCEQGQAMATAQGYRSAEIKACGRAGAGVANKPGSPGCEEQPHETMDSHSYGRG